MATTAHSLSSSSLPSIASADIKCTRAFFLGEPNIGKHALISYWMGNVRASSDSAPPPHAPTAFSAVSVLRLPKITTDPSIDPNVEAIMTMVDERDQNARITHFRRVNADAVVIMYSATNRDSFIKVPAYLQEVSSIDREHSQHH
jgi:GTPase SAR1 family protein